MKKASQQTSAPSVLVFYSYAHEDEALRDELEKHLSTLQRQGLIISWHDRLIMPGTDWEREIDAHLNAAQVILLLISADFLASDYCYGIEMSLALERHENRQCHVIPILLRPVDWQNTRFAHLQCLPRKKAVTEFNNRDAAFREITKGIREVIEHLNSPSRPRAIIDHKHRQYLLRRVRNFWIESVLDGSLHHAIVIALELQKLPDAVANPWSMIMLESNRPAYPLPQGTKTTHIFDKADGQLLILGEPGAGKTTLLLELARDLLNRAEYDELPLLPVVFHLSSWAQKRQPFSVWLAKELETKYEVPRKIAETWVDADQILPLLDGFDEVAENRRLSCITTINAYRRTHPLIPMVICSRKDEYAAQAARFALRDAVSVQPLTQEQIDKYLTSVGPQLEAVRRALHEDAGLRELATTPLWLSVLTLAYQGISAASLVGVASDKQRQLILEKYVEHMLTRGSQTRYTTEQTKRCLACLAKLMRKFSITILNVGIDTASIINKKEATQWVIGGAILGLEGGPVGVVAGAVVGSLAFATLGAADSLTDALNKDNTIMLYCLWRAGIAPLNYRHFLDYAAEHILLRKVGPGYIFVHQLLLDYFTSLDVSNSNDISSTTD